MELKAVKRRATKVKEGTEQLFYETKKTMSQFGEKRAEREHDQLLQVHEG